MAIFRLEGDTLIPAPETNIEFEEHLETWLENSPWAVIQDELVLWIDRQPSAQDEEGTIFPDLLGVDSEGNLVIIEFKRGKTPRDVVAQLLEYAAWANELPVEQIHEIADTYFEKRDEFRGKTFAEVFREVFDIPETDELPPLKRKLRLFVVAEEIQPRVARVCQFLRTSYKIDVSCIAVSKFQTESGDEIVSTDTKVGDEEIVTPKTQQRNLQTARWSGDKPVQQVVWDAVQELTQGKTDVEFAIKEVKAIILKKDPSFKEGTVNGQITADCVNHPSRRHHPSAKDEYYWRVERGIYRLYDSEKDKVENDSGAN